MNYLKILWQHLFQQKNTSSEHAEELADVMMDFPAEPLSVEAYTEFMRKTAFQELVTQDGSLQFHVSALEGELESSAELTFQTSELLLNFEVPDFPEDDLNVDENDMQGLDEHFWEEYVFDEHFLNDIPDFTASEFQSLPADTLTIGESED